jgi:hypothetical protein
LAPRTSSTSTPCRNCSRSLASAAGPVLAGYLLSLTSFGWPLVIAGGLKAIYDLLLLRRFAALRPPEEVAVRES